ncbi:MAG: ABC transporter permease, partial [Clostridia bacterium]|nr:ABC transporter permease [Clostridia bacterium]
MKVFFKNKTALVSLFALGLVLLFTLIQPLLPGQYDANRVY